jgi:hypothetical protein
MEPIPMSPGTVLQWVWVWVDAELPMGYPRHALRMSCGHMIMVLFDYVSSESFILWDVDLSSVKDKSVF